MRKKIRTKINTRVGENTEKKRATESKPYACHGGSKIYYQTFPKIHIDEPLILVRTRKGIIIHANNKARKNTSNCDYRRYVEGKGVEICVQATFSVSFESVGNNMTTHEGKKPSEKKKNPQ